MPTTALLETLAILDQLLPLIGIVVAVVNLAAATGESPLVHTPTKIAAMTADSIYLKADSCCLAQ